MRIAVLSRKRTLYSTRRLIEEIKKKGHDALVLNPLNCDIIIADGRQNINYKRKKMPEIDSIIPRIGTSITRYGTSVLRQLVFMGIPSVSSPIGIAIARDKFRSLQVLTHSGINVPKSILVRNPVNIEKAIKRVGGVPVLIKLLRGTQGIGVIYIDSLQAASSTLETLWSMGKQLLIQEFIYESRGTDIRSFVVDDKVVASYRRIAKSGEFRSNMHKGAIGEPIELTDEQRNIVINSVKALNLGVAGVDMLKSSEGMKVLEVNASPGLKGIEKFSDCNVAEAVVDYAVRIAKKRTNLD
ncbi:RimK family alpha-L-glutamate ligase [candidate division KSB1 bacterium]